LQRTDLWPLFTAKRDRDGNGTAAIDRSAGTAVAEQQRHRAKLLAALVHLAFRKSARTGASSQSFLWNLYRLHTTPETRKCSLLFGLIQYQSGPEGKRLRMFYVPVFKTRKPPVARLEP